MHRVCTLVRVWNISIPRSANPDLYCIRSECHFFLSDIRKVLEYVLKYWSIGLHNVHAVRILTLSCAGQSHSFIIVFRSPLPCCRGCGFRPNIDNSVFFFLLFPTCFYRNKWPHYFFWYPRRSKTTENSMFSYWACPKKQERLLCRERNIV